MISLKTVKYLKIKIKDKKVKCLINILYIGSMLR